MPAGEGNGKFTNHEPERQVLARVSLRRLQPPKVADSGSPCACDHHGSKMPNKNVGRVLNGAVKSENGDADQPRKQPHGCARKNGRGEKSFSQEQAQQSGADGRANHPQPEARDTERDESIEIEIVKKH